MAIKKTQRIGFDLDGVIIDKPPFMPKSILEWAIRNHTKRILSYRYPSEIEQLIRMCIHYPLLRPPIKENVHLVKNLSRNNNIILFAITGRYKFLKDRTYEWLQKQELTQVFHKVYINERNKQPHKFKEEMIEQLKLNTFIEDDEHIVEYLTRQVKKTKICLYKKGETDVKKMLSL